MEKVSEYFFKIRGLVGGLILVPVGFLAIVSTPHFSEGSAIDIGFDSAAWAFLGACIGLRLWATLFVGGRKDTELVTSGPYSLCRNPLYLGSVCGALSLALFLASLTLLGAVLVVAAVYSQLVIPAEERRLEAKFGEEYRRYCATTPRLVPRTLSFKSPAVVEVNLPALRAEAQKILRLWLIPILGEIFGHLRTAAWFPHWFRLP